jgi:hypothetical protein
MVTDAQLAILFRLCNYVFIFYFISIMYFIQAKKYAVHFTQLKIAIVLVCLYQPVAVHVSLFINSGEHLNPYVSYFSSDKSYWNQRKNKTVEDYILLEY